MPAQPDSKAPAASSTLQERREEENEAAMPDD
jgi:hypothetical protein